MTIVPGVKTVWAVTITFDAHDDIRDTILVDAATPAEAMAYVRDHQDHLWQHTEEGRDEMADYDIDVRQLPVHVPGGPWPYGRAE